MNPYKQLTEAQRYQIQALKKAETSQVEISWIIGISVSTISRELKRNTGQREYRPKQAHNKALKRRRGASKAIKMTPTVVSLIESKIRLDWSPEQVSGWLEEEQSIKMSHERIYQHIWTDKGQEGELYKHLRQSNKKALLRLCE